MATPIIAENILANEIATRHGLGWSAVNPIVIAHRSILLAAALLAALASPAHAEVHYAPEERLNRIDVELINNAETSIDMAAYVLSDWAIIDALNDAEARGVKVRVILDPREHSNIARMTGLDVRQKAPGPIQHLKAYEIDGQILRTGSENFSHSAPTQDNDLIVIRDPAAAAKFEAHFERMWDAAIPINATSAQSFFRPRSVLGQIAERWGWRQK